MISDKLGYRNILLTVSGVSLAFIVLFISQIENIEFKSYSMYGLLLVFPVLYGIFSSLYYSSLSFINSEKSVKMVFSISIVFENIGYIFLLGLTNLLSNQRNESFNAMAYNQCLLVFSVIGILGGLASFIFIIKDSSLKKSENQKLEKSKEKFISKNI